jgi:hypothetical protein
MLLPQLLMRKEGMNPQEVLHLQDLPAGTYLIRMSNQFEQQQKVFIKQ